MSLRSKTVEDCRDKAYLRAICRTTCRNLLESDFVDQVNRQETKDILVPDDANTDHDLAEGAEQAQDRSGQISMVNFSE